MAVKQAGVQLVIHVNTYGKFKNAEAGVHWQIHAGGKYNIFISDVEQQVL